MARRKALAPTRLSKDTQRVYDVFNTGTDLACVLTAVAYLDECLHSLLLARLVDSDQAESLLRGAVGRFSTRRELAFSLGLVDQDSYEDLVVIGEIRNRFAHSHLVTSFEDGGVQAITRTLKRHTLAETGDPNYEKQLTEQGQRRNARTRFSISAAFIAQELLITAHHVAHLEPAQPYA